MRKSIPLLLTAFAVVGCGAPDAPGSSDPEGAEASATLDAGPCATPYSVHPYSGGEKASNKGSNYQCKAYPYSGWCGLGGAYEPGVGFAWQDAWTLLGTCGGSTSTPSTQTPSTQTPSTGSTCAQWTAGTFYATGTIVTYNGSPYIAEHDNPGYDPTISTWFWDPYTGSGCGSTNTNPTNPTNPTTPTTPTSSGIGGVVSEALFNQMFPHRNGFYTYQGLVSTAQAYSAFANSADTTQRKREAAAFLANVGHETGDLVYIEEINKGTYCGDWCGAGCPAGADQYFGRGPIQLSWNCNYKAAGEAIGVDLWRNPWLVAQDAAIAWKTGVWFWMTQSGAGTRTPHDGILNTGFGETIRSINGSLECNGANPGQVQSRIDRYKHFCDLLGVSYGDNLYC